MKEIYPLGVPEVIETRYKTALGWLEKSEFLDDFEIFRLLSEEGKKTSQYMAFRGMAPSSFLIYLLGNNRLNPLKAHYYCRKCGHIEVVNTHLFGIDLPKISCPVCNEELVGDGFNLPLESVWGTDGKKHIDFDYNISSEFLPFVKRVMLIPNGTIEHLMQLQRKSGIYVYEIGINELRELTYYDLINSKNQ